MAIFTIIVFFFPFPHSLFLFPVTHYLILHIFPTFQTSPHFLFQGWLGIHLLLLLLLFWLDFYEFYLRIFSFLLRFIPHPPSSLTPAHLFPLLPWHIFPPLPWQFSPVVSYVCILFLFSLSQLYLIQFALAPFHLSPRSDSVSFFFSTSSILLSPPRYSLLTSLFCCSFPLSGFPCRTTNTSILCSVSV